MSASLHDNTGTIKALLAVKADTEAKGSFVSDGFNSMVGGSCMEQLVGVMSGGGIP